MFHMALSGRLSADHSEIVQSALAQHLPPLPQQHDVNQISLVGERIDGRFETIKRFDLTG